jgi:hypothetical protein
MNSKVGIHTNKAKLGVYIEIKRGITSSILMCPWPASLAPIYRWMGLEDLVGFDTN